MFQIRDDYKNLRSDAYAQKKGACEDIKEGKYSFLIVHNMHTDPESKIVRSILRQKTGNDRMRDVFLCCLNSTGSFEYTERVLEGFAQYAERLIITMDDGRGKSDMMLNLVKMLRV
jgi:geranylgeranyl diphosphate synthase type 3